MSSVGRDIENAIQSMLNISDEFANLQTKLDKANSDLNMLETLFSVSRYIGSDPETHVVLSVLADSIKGVFGTSSTQVIFDDQKRHLSISNELYEHFNFETLKKEVSDSLVIHDVSESSITTLDKGTLILIRLSVGDELYGFLACHWAFVNELSKSSLVFLQIISTQVSMYLKSAKLIDEFKSLAVIDPLTSIYNRSYFSNIEATTQPILGESIIMFDIDHFKKINDTCGHQFGDEILKHFSKILARYSDTPGSFTFKFGGEEFVIKTDGGESKALHLADQVRKTFTEETGYTVSAGISTVGTSCCINSYSQLLKQADDALYVSKQCGRNKTTVSTSDIQILKQSATSLSNLVSKSFRQQTSTSIFRFKLMNSTLLTEEQFEEVRTVFTGIARLYDEVFFTASLDVLLIVYGKIDVDQFVIRAFKTLKEQLSHISYDIHSLDAIFKEVIIHSSRVSELSQILGAELGYDAKVLNQIRLACEWHDVGKICTDPVIYSKTSPLTSEEYEVIKLHSWLSYSIAYNHPILSEFANWVLYHHEDFNGRGYYGIKGNDIPYPAQIISLVDKFDALTEHRCYRPAYSWQDALSILKEESVKFDSVLFNHFEKMVHKMMQEKPLVILDQNLIS